GRRPGRSRARVHLRGPLPASEMVERQSRASVRRWNATLAQRQCRGFIPMNGRFMREAIRLSLKTLRGDQGGPFCAVIVQGNRIVGRGWNRVTSDNDPTAHAETVAIRDACRRLKTFALVDCDLYTSCEPCPMCLSAVYWAHIRSVFYGNTRQDAARIAFDDEFIYREVALPIRRRQLVMKQLLRKEAQVAFIEWEKKADKVRN